MGISTEEKERYLTNHFGGIKRTQYSRAKGKLRLFAGPRGGS